MALPPAVFGYSEAVISEEVRDLDPGSLDNLPFGVDRAVYAWADLDGEGLAGVLSQQAGEMFYKPSLGGGQLGPSRTLDRPGQETAAPPGSVRLLDLDADGALELTRLTTPAGYFTRTGPPPPQLIEVPRTPVGPRTPESQSYPYSPLAVPKERA
jgi:hypothetical protein